MFDTVEWERQARRMQQRIVALEPQARMQCQTMLRNCRRAVDEILKIEFEHRLRRRDCLRSDCYQQARTVFRNMVETLEEYLMLAFLVN